MGKQRRYTAEQIINKLREAEVLISQGKTIGEAARQLGVAEQTYYRWRSEYGGMKMDQARRLKDLEKENVRLKKAVAELTLDKLILKEAAEGPLRYAPAATAGRQMESKSNLTIGLPNGGRSFEP